MTPKRNQKITAAAVLETTDIKNVSRYRVKSLPSAGALLREEDCGDGQISLL